MINFRLEVFYTTAKELSFTKAAELLSISQPAVTKHIKALEEHYQTPLFDRIGNNIELTDAGKILFQYAHEIVNTYELLNADLQHLSLKKQSLKIGTSSSFNSLFLANMLGYSKYLPFDILETQISLPNLTASSGLTTLDLILSDSAITHSGFESELLLSSTFSLICASDSIISVNLNPEYINYAGNIFHSDTKLAVRHKLSSVQSALHALRQGNFVSHFPEILIKNQLENNEMSILAQSDQKYELYLTIINAKNEAINQFREIIKKNNTN